MRPFASSRQDILLSFLVGSLLATFCVLAWRYLGAHLDFVRSTVEQGNPKAVLVARHASDAMGDLSALVHDLALAHFIVLGWGTYMSSRHVALWPGTADGSPRIAFWSALTLAAVALALAAVTVSALGRAGSPAPAYVPAAAVSCLVLQCVAMWMASHRLHGFFWANLASGRELGLVDHVPMFVCLAVSFVLLKAVNLAAFPFGAWATSTEGEDPLAHATASFVPFGWVGDVAGLPDGVAAAVSVLVSIALVAAGALFLTWSPTRRLPATHRA